MTVKRPRSSSVDPYYAMALQIACKAVNQIGGDREVARKMRYETISRVDKAIGGAQAFHGRDLKLVVLPEYFMTGHPFGESIGEWRGLACIDPYGAEYEALGEVAEKHDVYLAGNAYESDPHFPDLYFQTSMIFAPNGTAVLRYRRLISLFAPSPYDVLDAYLDAYGDDALFPVADTEIGRLAAIASEEILYPEIARCHALKGAEVFVHSTSEAASNRPTVKNVAKQARAIENLACVVSANSARIEGSPVLAESTDFGSQVVNHRGHVLVEAGYGESINAHAEIDIEAQRRYRRRAGMGNMLSRLPTDLFARAYAETSIQPENNMADHLGASRDAGPPDRTFFATRQQDVIEGLMRRGVLK